MLIFIVSSTSLRGLCILQSRLLLLDDKVRWFCVKNKLSNVYHVVAVGVQETLFEKRISSRTGWCRLKVARNFFI